MKNQLVTSFIIFGASLSLVMPIFSQSPSPATSEAKVNEDVSKLKEKVAEKVQELKKNNKKAVAGYIKKIENNIVKIITKDESEIEIEIDDTLTSFYDILSGKIVEKTQSDFKIGDYIFSTGPEIDQTLTANEIYKDREFNVFSGKISSVDSDKFTISVVSVDKITYTLDIEKSTKIQLLNIKTLETEKIGFSKLKEGDSVHVVVKADPKDPKQTRFSADKLLVIPNEYFLQ